VGTIENKGGAFYSLSGSSDYVFLQLTRDLEGEGTLEESISKPFSFNKADLSCDSYDGQEFRLRYFLKAEMVYQSTLRQSTLSDSKEIAVKNYGLSPFSNPLVTNGVALELQASFHPNPEFIVELSIKKTKVHLEKERIEGRIKFKDASVDTMERVKQVRLDLVQSEIQGATTAQNIDKLPQTSRVVKSFELTDGCPGKGESIPFRMSLRGTPLLTPTMKNIHNRFNVRYFVRLVVVSQEEGESKAGDYEIVLWR